MPAETMSEENKIKNADTIPALTEEEEYYDDSDESAPRWYVVHTYSGHENKVKSSIEKLVGNYGERIELDMQIKDRFGHPIEQERDEQGRLLFRSEGRPVYQAEDGLYYYEPENADSASSDKQCSKDIKPVYMAEMIDLVLKIQIPMHDVAVLKDGQHKINSRKMFPGYVLVKMIVTDRSWYVVRNTQGVMGFVGYDSNEGKKNRPLPLSKEEVRRMGIEKVNIELDLAVGDSIKVINGPFESFTGVIEEVNPEKETLKARISMFGRDTPVELIFDQVDKVY